MKSQAAVEYLMTHMYMIVIIMIVLGSLFYLGIFNLTSNNRAQPGNCYVYRPDGPGTEGFINLEGICNNELPKFVSHFSYTGSLQFGYSNVSVPSVKFMPLITNANGRGITMTGWIYSDRPGIDQTAFAYGNFSHPLPPYEGIYEDMNTASCSGGFVIIVYYQNMCVYQNSVPQQTWLFIVAEYNGSNTIGYMINNGNVIMQYGAPSAFAIEPRGSFLISTPWNGLISNVQLYNTSLSRNSIMALYNEGLGGTPINLQNLVGWWPLNGNAQDYSGNQNSAFASNSAFFPGAFDANYTPP